VFQNIPTSSAHVTLYTGKQAKKKNKMAPRRRMMIINGELEPVPLPEKAKNGSIRRSLIPTLSSLSLSSSSSSLSATASKPPDFTLYIAVAAVVVFVITMLAGGNKHHTTAAAHTVGR
jgi:hypothetical protein